MLLVPTKFWGKVWLLSCQMFHKVHQQVSGCVRLLFDAEQVVDDVFFQICLLKLLWPKNDAMRMLRLNKEQVVTYEPRAELN